MVRSGILVVAAGLLAGCYNYESLGRSHLVPSTYLAVTLTESGSEELARYVGPGVLVVRGRFLSASDRGLAISVSAVETRRGNIVEWAGETVVVPGEFVREVEQRHSAVGKTVLLAGASLAGFIVAYAAFGPASGGGPAPTGGTGTTPR
jgi:hypothetical protein